MLLASGLVARFSPCVNENASSGKLDEVWEQGYARMLIIAYIYMHVHLIKVRLPFAATLHIKLLVSRYLRPLNSFQ